MHNDQRLVENRFFPILRSFFANFTSMFILYARYVFIRFRNLKSILGLLGDSSILETRKNRDQPFKAFIKLDHCAVVTLLFPWVSCFSSIPKPYKQAPHNFPKPKLIAHFRANFVSKLLNFAFNQLLKLAEKLFIRIWRENSEYTNICDFEKKPVYLHFGLDRAHFFMCHSNIPYCLISLHGISHKSLMHSTLHVEKKATKSVQCPS